VSFAMIRGKN